VYHDVRRTTIADEKLLRRARRLLPGWEKLASRPAIRRQETLGRFRLSIVLSDRSNIRIRNFFFT
jgi:uncharacterized protein with von Willebrand factor type A (vWA) domain